MKLRLESVWSLLQTSLCEILYVSSFMMKLPNRESSTKSFSHHTIASLRNLYLRFFPGTSFSPCAGKNYICFAFSFVICLVTYWFLLNQKLKWSFLPFSICLCKRALFNIRQSFLVAVYNCTAYSSWNQTRCLSTKEPIEKNVCVCVRLCMCVYKNDIHIFLYLYVYLSIYL